MKEHTDTAPQDTSRLVHLSDNHREVVLRHHDGASQDIELTVDEAYRVADLRRAAAATARAEKVDG